MPSSYTDGIAIEEIGSQEQAGTWSNTSNDNLKRLEQGVAEYAEVTLASTPTTWTLTNTDGAYVAGSEGRALYVKFRDDGDIGGTVTVNIRGTSGSDYPRRCFFVTNGLTNQNLILASGGGGTVTIPNGYSALVYTDQNDSDAGVVNGLKNLSIGNISLENGETIENTTNDQINLNADTIKIGVGDANATLESSGNFDLLLSTGRTDTPSSINIDGASAAGDVEVFPGSTGVVKVPVSCYLNFGATGSGSSGESGYGWRDDGGDIKLKDSGGSWGIPAAGAVSLFTQSYDSGLFAFTLTDPGQLYTKVHGFNPNKPLLVQLLLEVVSPLDIFIAGYGFDVGDQILVNPPGSMGGAELFGYGSGYSYDDTNIYVAQNEKLSFVTPSGSRLNLSGGFRSEIIESFNFIVRAWR